jgi:general secretion pathway protein G
MRNLNRSRASSARKAFTLIELLLVLVILAVLAAVVVPKFANRTDQAKRTAAVTDVSHIDSVLDMFEVDNGRYPTTEEGLAALLSAPSGLQSWHGPYLKKGMPVDPWQRPYVYQYPGSRNQNGPDLYSVGPDGQEGSEDDIGNW